MSALELLRTANPAHTFSASEIFQAAFEAGTLLSDSDRESDEALEIAIRLLESQRLGQIPPGCEDAVNFLAEECGLYPYINLDHLSHLRRALIEAHGVDLRGRLYLHAKQMKVLLWLLGGDNVILSAPTSFGKSLLVDAFIAHREPHTVVMILPTIALIDECRRRIERTFAATYDVITNSTDEYLAQRPTVFILTQERFLQRKDISKIDFLFVDEFYKLDPSRDDGRFETLNLALYKALPKSQQCFMAGPHIRGIELGAQWSGNFRFYKTDFRTVTVNVIDRSGSTARFDAFISDLKSVGEESSLVFTAVPKSAENLADQIVAAGVTYDTTLGNNLSRWIGLNYHRDWAIAAGTAHGIAVHHGRVPRSLGQLFVQLFDSGQLKVLICTSTLIEGVNTAAANVFIYDKKINRSDFDFFSFANIRGRVGRMMRHFVGNAYLYHEPPSEVETSVEVPVLANPGSSTDYLVINVDREELSQEGRARFDRLPTQTGLPAEILREHGAMGTGLLQELAEKVQQLLTDAPSDLVWSGFPDKAQRIAAADLLLYVAHKRRETTGLHTPKQVAWAWSQLNYHQSMPSFLSWFVGTFDGERPIDAAFQFLQACEFSFSRTLGVVEALVRHLEPSVSISYGAYIVGLENWFRPPWMKQLDEAGIPMPLAERLQKYLKSPNSRADALSQITNLDLAMPELDDVDRFILRQQQR